MKPTTQHITKPNGKLWAFNRMCKGGEMRSFTEWLGPIEIPKAMQPNFKSYLQPYLFAIFIDFDKLPTQFETWEGLSEYLSSLPNVGVFTSSSGKPKGIVLVEGSCSSPRKALATIETILGSDLASNLDKGGLLHSYIPVDQFGAVEQLINTLPRVPVCNDGTDWEFCEGFVPRPGLKAQENAILHFMASHPTGEVELSQRFIAQQTGFGLSTICAAIKSLREKGIIQKLSDSFLPGVRSKKYCLVAGLMATLFVNQLTSQTSQPVVVKKMSDYVKSAVINSKLEGKTLLLFLSSISSKKELPTVGDTGYISARLLPSCIEDGNWYSELFTNTRFFITEEEYLSWVCSLPGWNKPGKRRYKQAKYSWKSHQKRISQGKFV